MADGHVLSPASPGQGGREGLLLGAGAVRLGNRLDFLFFNKTSMVFPQYIYKKSYFLHNLVKYKV